MACRALYVWMATEVIQREELCEVMVITAGYMRSSVLCYPAPTPLSKSLSVSQLVSMPPTKLSCIFDESSATRCNFPRENANRKIKL